MAKTRLNKAMRDELMDFAHKHVKTDGALDKAAEEARAKAEAALLAARDRAVSSAEMAVLQKHGFVRKAYTMFYYNHNGWSLQFAFKEQFDRPEPTVRIKVTEEEYKLIEECNKADEEYLEAVNTKLNAYRQLINVARYIEDVVAVWPAAEGVIKQAVNTLPSSLTADMIALIKSDNAGKDAKADIE